MQWIIPGTTLSAQREQAQQVDQVFHSLFLAGGLTLSQVASLTGLEPHTIQNWVKRGFLPPPQGKRYSMEQLCRILNMHILKGNMNLDQIVKLMQYLNGNLADESDDQVDDTQLYFCFVRLAARVGDVTGADAWQQALEKVTEHYRETVPGVREKLPCKGDSRHPAADRHEGAVGIPLHRRACGKKLRVWMGRVAEDLCGRSFLDGAAAMHDGDGIRV